jgi:outer membrane protein assembly factor BamB
MSGKSVSGTFCAKHPKGEFLAKGAGYFSPHDPKQRLLTLVLSLTNFLDLTIMNIRLSFAALLLSLSSAVVYAETNWLSFRGEGGRGDASTAQPPTDFDVPNGKNVAWKSPTTGRGIGGPLVIEDLVVVTGCDGEDQRDIHVEAFDRETGNRRWLRSLRSIGRPYTHPTSANASPSPVSDGSHVIALFSSCDLVCLDLEGRVQWTRALALDHPKTGNDISMSSSPTISGGIVCIQLECQGESFATGIDIKTGKTVWVIDRPRDSNWTTPQPVELGDATPAFVLQDATGVSIVRAAGGEQLHRFDLKCDTTASSTYAPPLIIVPGDQVTALRIDSTTVEIAWQNNRLKPQRCSPVVHGERVYMGKGSVLIAGNLGDGELIWQQRLPGINTVWATPIYTGAGIFVFDAGGKVAVVKDNGDSGEVIAEPIVGEAILATPAAIGDSLYLRTDLAVIRLTQDSQ